MRQAEVLQEVRLMKFDDVYSKRTAGRLTQEQAVEILGVSVRTVRRWEDRFEAEGAEGLYDRRLGKFANNRVSTDTVMAMLELFDTQYWDYTPKHFHEKLVTRHGFTQSYNWVRLTLQSHGRVQPAPRHGAHRRKRPRRPMVGMMLHQDGSSYEWVPDQWWDLIVTMDDANSKVYSAFFVLEEGTMSSFRALTEVIGAYGLFCSLYADRGSHYWHTPEAGGKVDKENLTQVGRALQQIGIELIPAYSPQARGRSERMFGTFQNRLPGELRSQGITTIEDANRFLQDVYLPDHNARFAKEPEDASSAFVPFTGNLRDTLCVQERRVVRTITRCATRAWSCRSRRDGIAITSSRRRSRSTNIPMANWQSFIARSVLADTGLTGPRSSRRTENRKLRRSGQIAWYLHRTIQNVLDIRSIVLLPTDWIKVLTFAFVSFLAESESLDSRCRV